jgi:hypothetical protein
MIGRDKARQEPKLRSLLARQDNPTSIDDIPTTVALGMVRHVIFCLTYIGIKFVVATTSFTPPLPTAEATQEEGC